MRTMWAWMFVNVGVYGRLLDDDTTNKDHIVPSYTPPQSALDLDAFHRRTAQVATNARNYPLPLRDQAKTLTHPGFGDDHVAADSTLTKTQQKMIHLLQERDWRLVVRDPAFRELLKKEMARSGVNSHSPDYDIIIDTAATAAERVEKMTEGDAHKLVEDIATEAQGLDAERVATLYQYNDNGVGREARQRSIYDVKDDVKKVKTASRGNYNFEPPAPFAVLPLKDMVGIFQSLNLTMVTTTIPVWYNKETIDSNGKQSEKPVLVNSRASRSEHYNTKKKTEEIDIEEMQQEDKDNSQPWQLPGPRGREAQFQQHQRLRRAQRWQNTRPEDVSTHHYQAFILPGNKVNLRRWCVEGEECHEAAVRAAFQVTRGYMLALAETRHSCALWLLCDASARAATEGAVGIMAATLASGIVSQYPAVVSGADLRAVLTARNVGLRTADCSRFYVSGCNVASYNYEAT
ncbi:uncharacterized protein LOC121860630 isoform X2 [Homarus americanus]|uniref:uncharacterized protein LOC121860630 isoform X2 n=1 Tax=Homarus americanus TaxID=6706 RepID=UPI001C46231A|nr:uncharacterized protein LOC121860630 isoform X2 [Homarus americanus]